MDVGCIGYQTTVLPKNQSIVIDPLKEYYLYKGENIWKMMNLSVNKNNISCSLVRFPNNYKIKKKIKQSVKLYLQESYQIDWVEYEKSGSIPIPFTAIDKVEVFDLDIGKTIIYTTGGIAGCIGAFMVLFALMKESCPFIYAYDGENYEFTGEIYSGAIHPPLERHDYLHLPALKSDNDEYKIKITNEVKEIQHTNLTELVVIDHPKNTGVLIDKYGQLHTITEPQQPKDAISFSGDDVADLIGRKDNLNYMSGIPDEDNETMDGIILNFTKPKDIDWGKLIIKGKNSFWLDYIHGQFSELFGEQLDEWQEKQKSRSADDLMKWSLDQGIPLTVHLETESGWEFVDYYNVVGPLAAKDDVLKIDLSNSKTDDVNIKLEFGFLFWEIDYAAMDFSPNSPVTENIVKLSSAVDKNGTDKTQLLLKDDNLYYDQPNIGDEAILSFESPPMIEGMDRSIILHSKGHYEILRDADGIPDFVYLQNFRNPGTFSQFSRDRFLELYNGLND